jgi:hypothetical protein
LYVGGNGDVWLQRISILVVVVLGKNLTNEKILCAAVEVKCYRKSPEQSVSRVIFYFQVNFIEVVLNLIEIPVNFIAGI